MGESKLPIYAYVDETGNTGHNIFDEQQPDFFTAALVTKGDFDLRFMPSVRMLAAKFSSNSLHAQELGFGRLETIAGEFLRLLRISKAHFFVSRVEKKYLLATKIFDTIFDSGENAAVGWHHYNMRPLRLMLTFKLASITEMDTGKLFWACIIEKSEKAAYELLPKICEALQKNISDLPDARSREVLGEGLEWARTHPESIQIHLDKKLQDKAIFRTWWLLPIC